MTKFDFCVSQESVTIIESAEPNDDELQMATEPEEGTKEETEKDDCTSVRITSVTVTNFPRRASSVGDAGDDNFLNVPKPMTASSSAETLTGPHWN